MVEENKYEAARLEREKHVDAILSSKSKKKLVVAGPGTGKTYLFERILEGKKESLTLTFVNALVEDLSLKLYGLSDVRTLHGFALKILKKAEEKRAKEKEVAEKISRYSPNLPMSLRRTRGFYWKRKLALITCSIIATTTMYTFNSTRSEKITMSATVFRTLCLPPLSILRKRKI